MVFSMPLALRRLVGLVLLCALPRSGQASADPCYAWERELGSPQSMGIRLSAAPTGGMTILAFESPQAAVRRFDAAGDTLWTYYWPGTSFGALGVDADGSAWLGGQDGGATSKARFIKLSAAGAPLLTTDVEAVPGVSQWLTDVSIDQAHEVYFSGAIYTGSANDSMLVKADQAGNTLFARSYDLGGNDVLFQAEALATGGVVCSGWKSGDPGALLAKFDALGEPVWTRTYGGPGGFWAAEIREDGSGGFFLGGASLSPSDQNGRVARFDAAGNTLWESTFDVGTYETVSGLSFQAPDVVWAAASSFTPTAATLGYLLKIDASNGALLSSRSFALGVSPSVGELVQDAAGDLYMAMHAASVAKFTDGACAFSPTVTITYSLTATISPTSTATPTFNLSDTLTCTPTVTSTNTPSCEGWNRVYDDGRNDSGQALYVRNGHAFVEMTSDVGDLHSDVKILEYDANGALLRTILLDPGMEDTASAIYVDPAGHIYAVVRGGPGTNRDLYLYKLEADGTQIWVRSWDSGADESTGQLAVDGAGDLLLAYGENGPPYNWRIRKIDPDGNQLWATMRDDPGYYQEYTTGIVVDPGGDFYVVGTMTAAGINHYQLVKYDGLGNVLWTRIEGGTYHAHSGGVALDGVGNAYVCGNRNFNDAFVTKYDPAGTLLWTRIYDRGGEEYFNDIALAADGSLLLGGSSSSATQGGAILARINGDGDLLWQRALSGPKFEWARAVFPGVAGEFWYTGGYGNNMGEYRARTVKMEEALCPGTPTPMWTLSATVTGSAVPTATATHSPSPTTTDSATQTASPSGTASATPSGTLTETSTATPTATPSSTATSTLTASATFTPEATPSPTPTASPGVLPTPSPSPAPTEDLEAGRPEVLNALAVPNPLSSPHLVLALELSRHAETVEARLYDQSFQALAQEQWGPVRRGWSRQGLDLPAGLASGTYYLSLEPQRGPDKGRRRYMTFYYLGR